MTKEEFLQQICNELKENINKLQNTKGVKLTSVIELGKCPYS